MYFATPLHLGACKGYRRPSSRRRVNDSLSAVELDNYDRLLQSERLVKRKKLDSLGALTIRSREAKRSGVRFGVLGSEGERLPKDVTLLILELHERHTAGA